MMKMNDFPFQIFRAYDIRGKVEMMKPELIQGIADALANQLIEKGQSQVALGYDARLSSPVFAQIIRQVFQHKDIDVTEIGCCSTPQLYFAARNTQGNGIMVTASHNPKTDNGIKWIIQSEPPSPEMIQHIGVQAAQYLQNLQFVEFVQQSQFQTPSHQIKSQFCLSYQSTLLNDIQLKRPLKVVIDGLNGSAGFCANLVLKKLGCDVIALRCNADGNFPDHAPDPSQATHLELLRQNVLNHQADIGIALDGDGDRVVLLDENAHIISADRLLALFAQMCLKDHPQHEIVFDVKCSSMVRQAVERLGGQAKMIRTGSSFLRKYMSQSKGQAVFGGEYAGHYVFNDGRGLGYDDGLYAALRVMEYLCHFPQATLSEILACYPDRFYTEDTYISTHHTDPKIVLNEIEHLSHQFGAELSKIDGVRLDFEHGFGIIRASNTGEYFTVRFDADCQNRLDEIRQTFASMLSHRYPMIAQDILQAH
ncbi:MULTISPECIES: phosphomannomutase/phosphoglucomutase [unclassified Acinetobacter]|uniref:phosphomannomutase/phosphoglucomutase n=1 Tax=unclassified Acinetobacter TaxID=196816 RepID=UPI0018A96170|nr:MULTISPECIES: phosphomannomutase/phosphoglucomutase [unclassified Acinetobacter]MBJ9955089.1 phosphomannomutase/phosphoglucomutase [Acinetobacter baumannii]